MFRAKDNCLGFSLTQAVSQLGSFFTSFAISWIIIDGAKSAKWLAVYLSYSVILYAVFSLIAGRIMDLFPRKKVMILSDLAGFFCLAGLALCEAMGLSGLKLYFCVTFVVQFAGTLIMIGTQSVMGDFSGGKDVAKAQATFETTRRLVMLASPVIAGAALAQFPRWLIFSVDSLTYIVSLLGTLTFLPGVDKVVKEAAKSKLSFALPDIAWDRKLAAIVAFIIMLNLIYAPVMMMWPLLSMDFGKGPLMMGVLSSGFICGSFLGGLWVVKMASRLPRRQISMSVLFIAAGFLGFLSGKVVQPYLMALPAALLGFGFGSINGPLMRIVHTLVPQDAKGGFFGWMGFVGQIGQPVMLLLAGKVFSEYGFWGFISGMTLLSSGLYAIVVTNGMEESPAVP